MESAHKHHQLIVAGLIFFASFSAGYIGYSGIKESVDESLAGINSQVASLSEQMAAVVSANVPDLALDGVSISADGEWAIISYRKKGGECAYLVPAEADANADALKKAVSKKQAICKATGVASNLVARKIEDFPFLKNGTTQVRLVRIPKIEDMKAYSSFLRTDDVGIDQATKEISISSVGVITATASMTNLTPGKKYVRVRYTKNINGCARLVDAGNGSPMFTLDTKDFCGKNLDKKILTEYRPFSQLTPIVPDTEIHVGLVSVEDPTIESAQSVLFPKQTQKAK